MNSVEFLKSELKGISEQFPNVHIKYGYNSLIDIHIVELLPLIEYTTNKKLDDAWIPVSLKFFEMYNDEEVTFISSNSRLSLHESIFEFNANCNEESIMTEIYAPLTEQQANYDFCGVFPNGKIITSSFTITTTKKAVDSRLLEQHKDNLNQYLFAA
jgi:hypothetical protein